MINDIIRTHKRNYFYVLEKKICVNEKIMVISFSATKTPHTSYVFFESAFIYLLKKITLRTQSAKTHDRYRGLLRWLHPWRNYFITRAK